MLDHVSLRVSDFQNGKKFYSTALAPLGYAIGAEFLEWSVAGLGVGGQLDLWIKADGSKPESTHIAFLASSKEVVEAFYKAAIEAGATDNGKPGYRKEYSSGYFGAFVTDPDGHNVEAVFHDPNPTE